jgi:hypothetical protein
MGTWNITFYTLVLHPVARKDQYSINNHQSQPIPLSVITYLLFHTTCFGLHAGHHQVLLTKLQAKDQLLILILVATGGYLLNTELVRLAHS